MEAIEYIPSNSEICNDMLHANSDNRLHSLLEIGRDTTCLGIGEKMGNYNNSNYR